MRLRKKLYPIMTAALILSLYGMLSGQNIETKAKQNPAQGIPGLADKHLRALGKRMNSIGKEKTTYTGQLFDKHNNSMTVRIVHDVFGKARLEGFKDKDETVSFDGKRIKGSQDSRRIKGDAEQRNDEDLMEVFVMDNVEGMMESIRQGAAVRFLGSGIGPDPSIFPDYQGPRYDIYEVTTSVRCRQDQLVRTKMYYFDANTGLLASTRYYDRSGAAPVKHETRYSVWGDIDGSKYPARIEHYISGKLQFDFITESITNEESVNRSEY